MADYDFQRFFDFSVDMLCIAGMDGYFKCVNKSFERTLGWTQEEFLQQPFMHWVHEDDVEATTYELEKLASGQPTITFRNRYRCKDGTYRHLLWTSYPDRDNELLYAVAHDATELIQANEKLESWAYSDPLTGLHNRRSFDQQLEKKIELMKRMARPMSLLMLDVDRFKSFNDTFGHPAGDDVLVKISQILRQTVRSTDLVARYGGEEFCIILPDTAAAEAKLLAQKIRETVNQNSWSERLVTISAGVATLDFAHGHEELWPDLPMKLVNESDQALYQAKASGRNTVIHYDELGH